MSCIGQRFGLTVLCRHNMGLHWTLQKIYGLELGFQDKDGLHKRPIYVQQLLSFFFSVRHELELGFQEKMGLNWALMILVLEELGSQIKIGLNWA